MLRADSLLRMVDAVRERIGLGMLLCLLAEPEGDLVRLAPPPPQLDTQIWILTHPDLRRVQRIKALTDRRCSGIGSSCRYGCVRELDEARATIVAAVRVVPQFSEAIVGMSANRKKVVRFDLWIDPVFDERLRRESDIDLQIGARAGSPEKGWALLADAHVFHVSAAKDELPRWLFVDTALLEKCPNLLCVSSSGAGYDTVDVPACTQAGVVVMNQAGGNADSVAELTLGLMLDVSRRISECDRRLRRVRGFKREDVMGHELRGKVVGLVGIGHIGRRVAALAHAFGMTVLATDPYLTAEEIERRNARPASLDELLKVSDFVSLHCPRDRSTLKLMNARAFSAMKPGAIFISTARGGIHDEVALTEAIRSGHLAGAGLDVWEQEPPPLDHPLLAMDNVVATFHTAGVSHEARRNVAAIAAEQIVAALKGGRPPRLINAEAWPAYAARFERILGYPVQHQQDTLE